MLSLYSGGLELTVLPDTQNGFAFLEALSLDVSVESLGRSFDGVSAHTGMRVRPSTFGNVPSALQLLPGQSFYIGKATLSLVPEEHSDLPVNSSGLLPDSNFESYKYQVSEFSSPQQKARVGSTIMETPMPHRAHESENFTPSLEQMTGQEISGRKDVTKRRKSPLKRQVMRTVHNASGHPHSGSQPEVEKEDEHMADAAINEHGLSSSPPEVKTEDKEIASASGAKPLEQGAIDLEDSGMAGADLRGEYVQVPEPLLALNSGVRTKGNARGSGRSPSLEEQKPLSSPTVPVLPAGGPGSSSHSPILTGSKPWSSSVTPMQTERGGPEASDQSPSQAVSDSALPLEDDFDDTPVRKKAKTSAGISKAMDEESQDSLQNEVISVKRGLPTQKILPVLVDQAPSVTKNSHSRSANQSRQGSPLSSTGSKRLSPAVDSDLQPGSANQPPSGPSCTSTGANPRTPLSNSNATSASPSNSVEPNSSMRSTRSTAREEHNSPSSTNTIERILFTSSSSAGDSKPFLKFLSNKGVKKVQSVDECTVLCVGKALKKTSKLILAVLMGKDVITDSWVTDSVKANDLLSVVPYMARDAEKEAEWTFSLDEAIYRGKRGLKLLQDHTILFTPSAKKELAKTGFDELKEIVKRAGAKSVSSAMPKKSPGETPRLTIVIGTRSDTDVGRLHKLGWRVYVKDIISLSILRGKLDLESDEFLITEEQKKEGRKRKR